jgi:hypothetical protein
MGSDFATFIGTWSASGGAERANKDLFLTELCDALGVPRPSPTTGDPERDVYVFERDAHFAHEGGTATIGKVDLFKQGCFILEAKQGSEAGAKKLGTAKRETPAWNVAMKDAYGQALGYARAFDTPVPFLIVADLGYCFDLYAAFDGSWNYRPFPNAQTSRLFLRDLPTHADTLRKVFLDPFDLDPSRHAAKVTNEIAGYLANLAKRLEADGHAPDRVATFLMRCLFTMFAEDVGLLPERMFTDALEKMWIPNPAAFPGGVEALWRAMNDGGHLMTGKILKFNGGLFADPSALPLGRHALDLLALAAECNWADVEPAIFGTLLERALDPKERHALGAHYTPRAYVERLVRPTIEEPLREDWQLVQAQVRQLVIAAGDGDGGQALTIEEFADLDRAVARTQGRSRSAKKGARTAKMNEAVALLHGFHRRLCETRVLDPACGSGNFLYVTLDLFKRLEGEVLAALAGLGETQELLAADAIRVTPVQFRGIEVKRWAKEIAELVLWIGYLQGHFRAYGRSMPVPEPVLRDYKNIECRDAVLAWDTKIPLLDDAGKPVTRWDGESMRASAVTGEQVPDETARVPVYRYEGPRKAEWPPADFIVGNPPFVGNKRMRAALGDGYVEALRQAHDDVPETADFVMYWWNEAARRVVAGECRRFGLITTNSITQIDSRAVPARWLREGLAIAFAIPDHPWIDSADGAAVRIAISVGARAPLSVPGTLGKVRSEIGGEVELDFSVGTIASNLTVGADVTRAQRLRSNAGLSFMGVSLIGQGFVLEKNNKLSKDTRFVRPYVIGRDLTQRSTDRLVIDLFGLTLEQAQREAPAILQRLLETVKPLRDQNNRATYRERWWLYGEQRTGLRTATKDLKRYIATCRTATHRTFQFVRGDTVVESTAIAIALEDAVSLGVLSSRAHVVWSLAAGGRLGIGNDPRYNNSVCFEPYPFPVCGEKEATRVAALAEQLDDHRKRQQAQHPELTVTGMYNVLAKMRAGEVLSAKDKTIHEHGLVSLLRKIHDDLDAAVFDAYGWSHDLSDEQLLVKLVALNADRAEEERKGLVRWLRPDFQNPEARAMTQVAIDEGESDEENQPAAPAAASPWPKKLADQVAAVRDLLTRTSMEWSAADVAASLRGANEGEAVDVLDSLAALGLLVTYELPEGRRWRSAAYVSRGKSVPPRSMTAS